MMTGRVFIITCFEDYRTKINKIYINYTNRLSNGINFINQKHFKITTECLTGLCLFGKAKSLFPRFGKITKISYTKINRCI